MAYISTAKPFTGVFTSFSRPFVAVWGFLIAMAEANPKMIAVNKLSNTTDAELAARGTNREAEIRRIFAGQIGL